MVAHVSELEKALVNHVGRRKEPSKELLQRLKAHQAQERACRQTGGAKEEEGQGRRAGRRGSGGARAGPAELLCEALRLRVV